MNKKTALLTLSLAFSLPSFAGASDAPVPVVHIENFSFRPARLEVPAGSNVVWVNDDEEIHAVFATDGSFTSPGIDGDEKYQHQFTKPGVYEYRCSLHPQMHGTIVVR
jgi:plastocyanin